MSKKLILSSLAIGIVGIAWVAFEWMQTNRVYHAMARGELKQKIGTFSVSKSVLTSALDRAYATNRKEDFVLLLEKGANPYARISRQGFWHPLLLHAACDSDSFWIEKLLESGVDLDTTGKRGVKPLSEAIDNRRPENIALLLKYGAKIHERIGSSLPLADAASMRLPEVFELLIAYGVDINYRSVQYATFFDRYNRMNWGHNQLHLDALDDLIDDFNICLNDCNMDASRMTWEPIDNNGVGRWNIPRLREDEENTTNFNQRFIEIRKQRPESIYLAPEKWGIADRMH